MRGVAVDIRTPDGIADCHLFTASGGIPAPGIIFYMDGPGIRPALFEMAQRLADAGYAVLLPNMYYRAGPAVPFDHAALFVEGPERTRMMAMLQSVTPASSMRDTGAYLDFLDAQALVRPGKTGCVGYCMGGGIALTAAGTFPDRIAAAASIHGGRLATDAPDSPHQLAAKMRGKIYVGVAGIDPWLAPGETERLKAALNFAGVDAAIETYPAVKHGFAPPDMPAYDHDASERHWKRLLEFFGNALK